MVAPDDVEIPSRCRRHVVHVVWLGASLPLRQHVCQVRLRRSTRSLATLFYSPRAISSWDERNAPRQAFLPYLVQIPAYYFALSFGPFALLPSLIQFKWREDGPPKYLAVAHILNESLEDLGIFDPYYPEEPAPGTQKDEIAYVFPLLPF